MALQDREHIRVSEPDDFRAWLSGNVQSPGVWVIYPKRSSGISGPGYEDLVRDALCFGWVDSISGRVDETHTKLYFSPRKPGSGWAITNKRRVEELEAAGLMQPAGKAVIERAKADGSWNLIDGSETLTVPRDLTSVFSRHKGSRAHFNAFPPGVRKQILQWIEQARTPETRAKRIENTAELAAQNIRANQWRKKD